MRSLCKTIITIWWLTVSATLFASQQQADTLAPSTPEVLEIAIDSLPLEVSADTLAPSIAIAEQPSSKQNKVNATAGYWAPKPERALWYSLLLPGMGQIYNRSYWKVPVIYGLGAGCYYVISFQGRMFNEYSNAYYSMTDKDPNTNDYERLFEGFTNVDDAWKRSMLQKKMKTYRRYRDLCIFGAVLLYAANALDAFVDAHLYDFSITEDLSLQVTPDIEVPSYAAQSTSLRDASFGLKLSLNIK